MTTQQNKQIDDYAKDWQDHFTPQELGKAIHDFQQGSPEAGNQLYTWFLPLIQGVSYRYTSFSALGQDAPNIAWEGFFTLVKNYRDDDFAHFPGYAKKYLRWRLFDAALSRGYYDPHVEAVELEDLQLTDVQDQSWEQRVTNQHLRDCLMRLKPLPRETLQLYFFQRKTLKEIAAIQNRPLDGVRGTYRKACRRLRELY